MPRDDIRDTQTVTDHWEPVGARIEGVRLKRTRNVLTQNGWIAEIFQDRWEETGRSLKRSMVIHFEDHVVTDWYFHEKQTDFIFALNGRAVMVLWDGRERSATSGVVMPLRLDPVDPVLVVVPPGVWHAFRVLKGPFCLFNGFTHSYDYQQPDVWRLPPDTDQIPFDIRSAR